MDASRLGVWVAIGVSLGAAFGVALGNVGLGVALGPVAGIAIWALEGAIRRGSGSGDPQDEPDSD